MSSAQDGEDHQEPIKAIRVARVYDQFQGQGRRILVDRLWPRGIRKDDLPLYGWCRDLAPTTELRRWYGHQPERFEEFARRYIGELDDKHHEIDALLDSTKDTPLVLLTATKELPRSGAVVLADELRGRLESRELNAAMQPRPR